MTQQRKLGSDLPLASDKTNHYKYKNIRFNVVQQECLRSRRGGDKFIKNMKENNKSYKNSLSQLSMVETRFALDLPSKTTPKGFIYTPRIIHSLIQTPSIRTVPPQRTRKLE